MACTLTAGRLAIGYQQPLIAPFDLVLNGGGSIALLGVNGVGKSTLLRTLAGLQAPLAGTVQLDGTDLHHMPAGERARRCAVVITSPGGPSSMDVRTLVTLGRQPWTGPFGRLAPADREAVERAMARTGVEHLQYRALDQCSDGERQKAWIARALAQDTPVLLLDEPTAHLDLPNRAAIVRLLHSIARQDGRLVLFSTHDVQLALDLSDRIALLRPGATPWLGTPAAALAPGLLDAAFAGSGIRFDAATGTHRFVP